MITRILSSNSSGEGSFESFSRGYLPHWRAAGAIYFVTWRTSDSLPAYLIAQLREIREQLLVDARARSRGPEFAAIVEARREFGLHVDRRLDEGLGRCPLRDPRLAELVANALRHFEGSRYELYAWCVMPNHVHAVVQPVAGHPLSSIVHSWKSYTAHAAQEITGEAGSLWQKEYYDRVIRDVGELIATMRYVEENPAKAGLVDWRWVWCRERIW